MDGAGFSGAAVYLFLNGLSELIFLESVYVEHKGIRPHQFCTECHPLEGDYELNHVGVLAEARDEFWRKRGASGKCIH